MKTLPLVLLPAARRAYLPLSEVSGVSCSLYFVVNIYLLQSECCSVSALFSTKKSIVKIRRGVVSKAAGIHCKKEKKRKS